MTTTPLTPAKMLAALKAEGLKVREHAGWKTHARDSATGKPFGPVIGVLIHHTGGHNDKELCYNGRSDLPGPLCHAWLGKTDGLWLLSNGRANHAGLVDADVLAALRAEHSPLPKDDEADADGNDVLYGIEIENKGDGKDPYPTAQYEQAVLWAAAICRAQGWTEKSVAGHKEVQPGKIDPSFDMDEFRADVKVQLAKPIGKPSPSKPSTPAKPKYGPIDASNAERAFRFAPKNPASGTVKAIQYCLSEEGLYTGAIDGVVGRYTKGGYRAWQKRCGFTGQGADGIPGEKSLSMMAKKYSIKMND